MTTPALHGSCLASLLLEPQMTPFALAMKGVLGVQSVGLRPQCMAGLAFLHRLAFTPDIAPSLILVVALGAGHPAGFMQLVAEDHRRLATGAWT